MSVPGSDTKIGIVESFCYCYGGNNYYYHHDSRFIRPGAKGKERQEGKSPERTPSGAGRRLAGRLQPRRSVPGGQLQEAPEAPLQQVGLQRVKAESLLYSYACVCVSLCVHTYICIYIKTIKL